MPAVFVHGVPDTGDVWGPVVERLTRDDIITVRLPGFGEPLPVGFSCTNDEYASWLAREIELLGAPVDLVGHDWGSLMTQRIATTRPELIRTWALSGGAVHERFKWHNLAQQWQMPEVGEQVMATMTRDLIEPVLADLGHPDPVGCASHIDDRMKSAILALYRSAVSIVEEWLPTSRSTKPCLLLWSTNDPYASVAYGKAAAEQEGATFTLHEAGHWGIFERPADTARQLEEHWASA